MNLIEAFKSGQKGANKGLPMGEGLKAISLAINGVQRGRIYTVGAAPKGGKSTLVDVGFTLEPCIYVLENNAKLNSSLNIIRERLQVATDPGERNSLNLEFEKLQAGIIDLEIIYNSYEIDRVSKEFDFITHFLNRDYDIVNINLPAGRTYKGATTVALSSAYLKGELVYDTKSPEEKQEIIKVPPELFEKIKKVYAERIIPLVGEYDSLGKKVSKGIIQFLENKDNPTGIRNYLLEYASKNGTFLYKTSVKNGQTYERMAGYKPTNPNKYVIIITDHLRKLLPERGFQMKQTIDKFSEYAVEFRNTCNFSFVHIIHLNRSMSNVERRSYDDDRIFPTSDDIKETGEIKIFLCFSFFYISKYYIFAEISKSFH